jgi:hypothetical protein
MHEYEERAVEYAQNPALLQALTTKLRTNRLSCPLFDTVRWVRSIVKKDVALENTSREFYFLFALGLVISIRLMHKPQHNRESMTV